MIKCYNLSKVYDGEKVLNNFNYFFEDKGMYLLFGRSGSGKTTLLNILSGLIPFNNGEVSFDNINKTFSNQVSNEIVNNKIAYITQNVYLVEYLDIYSNLSLCTDDKKLIFKLLKKFKLEQYSTRMPNQLSGGERQRIAIIQAILMKKEIIFLDEPTSSLDQNNRQLVFEMLSELKKDMLIIISSHDVRLKSYSDFIIDFNALDKYGKPIEVKKGECKKQKSNMKKGSNFSKILKLVKCMNVEYKKLKFEKKRSFLLIFVFSFSILICLLCSNPNNKLRENVSNLYKINQLYLNCSDENRDTCNKIFDEPYKKSIVIIYARNILQEWRDNQVNFKKTIESTFLTLPIDSNWFNLSDKLLYGNYFENENDVILTYDYAKRLKGENMEQLIGQTLEVNMGKSIETFNICGIFGKFNKKDSLYFNAENVYIESLEDNVFVNSKFTENYYNNEVVNYYVIYFKNFSDMDKIYNKYYNADETLMMSYPELYLELINNFQNISFILYPLAIVAVIISLIFYFQFNILKTEYYKHNFCVYNYYGYSLKNVALAYNLSSLLHMTKILTISLIFSSFLGFVLNSFNSFFNIFPFKLFSFDYIYVIILFLSVLFLCLLSSFFLTFKIKKLGWYKILEESKDLL